MKVATLASASRPRLRSGVVSRSARSHEASGCAALGPLEEAIELGVREVDMIE